MSTPQSQLDSIAGLFDPPPSRAPSSQPSPNPHGAYDAETTGSWSISDAPKVKDWYRQTYGRDLPVTAFGQSATHDRMGLDHSDAMDVGINPASDEGAALRGYLRQNNIPFLAYDRAVPGAATAPHIHVGFPSHRGEAGGAAKLGSVSNLFDDAPESQAQGDALDSIKSLFDSPADEVVSVNAAPAVGTTQALPALQSQTFDVQTQEGRAARDERNATERTPGARAEVSVPLPSDLNSDAGAFVRDAYKSAAVARGVPPEFFDKWVSKNVPGGYSLHDAGGNQLTVADTLTPDAYDEKNHSVRLRLDANHLAKIIDDYNASKGLVRRASDWASSGEESPGEKVLDVARPAGQAAGYVLDKVGRGVNALTAAEWSQLRGTGEQANDLGAAGTSVGINPKGMAAMLAALEGEDVPEYARNPIGEAARNSQTLANINPRLPALAGAAGDLVDPLSAVPIEGVGELAEGGRLARAAEGAADAARGAGLLDRGLVEARPLGLEAARAANVAGMEDRLGRVLEVTRKVRGGEALTPEDAALADEIRAKYSPPPPPDPESLTYARSRRQFYAEQAASAKDPVARQAAQANADEYAADVARLEGRELHHSELQPRTDAGQFDGPPRSLPRRALDTASDLINAPKSIKSSMALHGPFRQGVFQAAAHPSFLKDAIASQVKAFASEDAFQDFTRSIIERPDYQEMKDAGLFLPSVYDAEGTAGTGALMREERFSSKAAEKIPGVRRSERAYLAAMDSLRTQAWDTYMADLTADGAQPGKETLSALADWVNVSTGRGSVPVLDRTAAGRKIVAALNTGFWSPRAMASRFNMISPYRLARNLASPATRDVAFLQLRDSMRAAGTLGATAALLSQAPGVRVGLNPYSADWGKVKVGNTSYDLVDGVPATARFVAQMARSFYREAEGAKLSARERPATLAKDFLRRRLSPAGQAVADVAAGETLEGEKPTVSGEATDLLAPFVVDEMYRGWLDAGGSSVGDALHGKPFRTGFKGAAKGLPSAVGIPSSTYAGRRASRGRLAEYARLKGISTDEAVSRAQEMGVEVYDDQER